MCRCHLAPVLMLSVGALALPVRRPCGFSPSRPLTASHRLAVGFPGRSVGLSPRVFWVLAGLTRSPCDLTPCPWGSLAFRHDYNSTLPAECQHLFHDFFEKSFRRTELTLAYKLYASERTTFSKFANESVRAFFVRPASRWIFPQRLRMANLEEVVRTCTKIVGLL